MVELKTTKYLRTGVTRPSNHKEVTSPIVTMTSDETFGNLGFTMYWETVTKAFVMGMEPHKHDFPQYLTFLGGDPFNFLDLHGEIELVLSEDGVNLEKHVINTATNVYIPAGLYHNPLIFKRVDKPIIFIDCYFARAYKRGGPSPNK